MTSREIKKTFLDFFKKKDHKIYPSSSLLSKDKTSLFTSAGVQQFLKDILKGEFKEKRVANSQICLRTDDIEEVGDDVHLTFFEMLGNWSFGDYWKKEAIEWAYEFVVNVLSLPKERIWVTIFKGEKGIPEDKESEKIWKSLGIKKILKKGKKDNFWGPIGNEGPCGPCTELHFEKDNGELVEIWNLVFMEYKKENGKFFPLPQKVVDTGIGLERLTAVCQKKETVFETDAFDFLIKRIEKETSFSYKKNPALFRTIADHMRAVVFVIAEDVFPSNVKEGYILRRLLRRIFLREKKINAPQNLLPKLIEEVISFFEKEFPYLREKEKFIKEVVKEEKEKYLKTISLAMREFEKILKKKKEKIISGKEAFFLYESYGMPFDEIKEIAKEKGFSVDEKGFEKEKQKHKEISKKGKEKIFEMVFEEDIKKSHTATHLLQASLRKILGKKIRQEGSRLKKGELSFDFSFDRKLTPEELKKVEELVLQKIKENLKVRCKKMPLEQAIKEGALAFYKERYPNEVFVYEIYNEKTGEIFSKEVCKGPHVKETGEIKNFKIIKEEGIGKGKRRIKAKVE